MSGAGLDDRTRALGEAWDRGYETAAGCYWHKPRNPFTGVLNDDDPDDYCPKHGGVGSEDECSADTRSQAQIDAGEPHLPGPTP